jgi:hypothetical protein
MKQYNTAIFLSFVICAGMSVLASGSVDPTTLEWSNCGSCPDPVEVFASGATVTVGIAGRGQNGQQNQALHVASTLLPPATGYRITFSYDLTTWDSYNADGTYNAPFNGGTGYWDSYSVSVSGQPYWMLPLSDPLTSTELPGMGFLWGGSSYGGNNPPQQNSGTTTITVKGDPDGDNYLNVGLDTATEPDADENYPSWGTFTILDIETTCDGDIPDIAGIPHYYQCGNANYTPYYHQPPAGQPGAWWALPYDGYQNTPRICDSGCALTAYAMALSYYGFPYDPGTLNTELNNLGAYGFNANHDVVWSSVSFLTGLEYTVQIENGQDGDNTNDLDSDLCSGNPDILEVTSPTSGGSHFVLAIGKTDGVYDIIDPGRINVTQLSYYDDSFTEVVRFVDPSSGAFIIYADATVQVLVTDPAGRQIGYSGGTIFNEIPGGYYGTEQLTEDDPEATTNYTLPLTQVLFIPSPLQGFYEVQETGVGQGPANIQIFRYNSQNLPQSLESFQVDLAAGQTEVQTTTYSTRTGDVNGDGYVNSLDLAIVQASFGTEIGEPGYKPPADVNGDGLVNIRDLAIVGKFDPPPSYPNVPPRAAYTNALTAAQVLALHNASLVGPPVTLTIAPAGMGSVTLTWLNGTLLQATNAAGPWTTSTAASPYTMTPTNSQMYFKVQMN